ncbi:MAG: DUF2007 domain-containing protein [Motiliproteus sp.]|nr:DUF2007 domain-containing protein [Motiliproteus sp.]MCW9052027.1 DUF2007 domain-containing protein [Motiliproteus sp.]
MVTIACFSLPIDAQIARAKLESEGIPAYVADEHTINMQWLYSDAMGGVRLQVPTSCVERARSLLQETNADELVSDIDNSTPCCPFCGSQNLQAITEGKRMAFGAFLLIGFPLWPFRHKQQCSNCGKTFR